MVDQAIESQIINSKNDDIISKLFKVMETMALINSTRNMEKLINFILIAVKEVMEVEASSLARVDRYKKELYFSNTAGGSDKIKKIRLKIGEGIAGQVAMSKMPMIVNDVSTNKHHYIKADRETHFTTKSILCVPLLIHKKLIGVLEALNKIDGTPFNANDVKIFEAFASQVAVALENARLNNLAIYDDLTGIYNRRYFNIWIKMEFNRIKRYKANLTLIMIDIDHFKDVNDTYGHMAGDYVLVKLVKVLKKFIRRKSDLFVRYGGEEFMLVLQETSLAQAVVLAEKYRCAVEKEQFRYQDKIIPVNYWGFTPEIEEVFFKELDRMAGLPTAISNISNNKPQLSVYTIGNKLSVSMKGLSRVEIYSITGKLLLSEKVNSSRVELRNTIHSGIYIVRAYNTKGIASIKKLLVK